MSKITDGQIFNIDFQDDVESYPLRKNFNTLKNSHNELVDTVSAASIGTTNAETTAARPYHTSLKDRLDSISDTRICYVKSGGVVSINGIDPQKVDITEVECRVNNVDTKTAATTSDTIAYTSSGTKFCITKHPL